MNRPVSADGGQIKLRPEMMTREKLYHCVLGDRIMLAFMDSQDVLHCYEIAEDELVQKARAMGDGDGMEAVFEDYVARKNLKN